MITTSDKWVRLHEPFDQLVDSLSAAVSDFEWDFLNLMFATGARAERYRTSKRATDEQPSPLAAAACPVSLPCMGQAEIILGPWPSRCPLRSWAGGA